jgi:hypothetical protein
MVTKKTAKKSNWKDIGDLRLPNSTWRLGKAARWFEKRLGLSSGALLFFRPDGSRARSDKTLRTLREEWTRKKARTSTR